MTDMHSFHVVSFYVPPPSLHALRPHGINNENRLIKMRDIVKVIDIITVFFFADCF